MHQICNHLFHIGIRLINTRVIGPYSHNYSARNVIIKRVMWSLKVAPYGKSQCWSHDEPRSAVNDYIIIWHACVWRYGRALVCTCARQSARVTQAGLGCRCAYTYITFRHFQIETNLQRQDSRQVAADWSCADVYCQFTVIDCFQRFNYK